MAHSDADLRKLLREAVKIIHCHQRNLHKDWLARARAALKQPEKLSGVFRDVTSFPQLPGKGDWLKR